MLQTCEASDIYVPDGGEYQLPHAWPFLFLMCILGYLHHHAVFSLLNHRRSRGFKRLRTSFLDDVLGAATHPLQQFRRCVSSSPRTSLHHLPPELLHEIFLNACTDGGRTGCSLALVSKATRALSSAARFNSVALMSGSNWKVRRFLKVFDEARHAANQEPGVAEPRIKHLCLLASAVEQSSWRLSKKRSGNYLSLEALSRIENTLSEKHRVAIEAVLNRVMGDLETLCLIRSEVDYLDGDKPLLYLDRKSVV